MVQALIPWLFHDGSEKRSETDQRNSYVFTEQSHLLIGEAVQTLTTQDVGVLLDSLPP